jgi:hypothetical protein
MDGWSLSRSISTMTRHLRRDGRDRIGRGKIEWCGSAVTTAGEVVEWLMAPVLKTGVPKGTVGSNPTLSVTT